MSTEKKGKEAEAVLLEFLSKNEDVSDMEFSVIEDVGSGRKARSFYDRDDKRQTDARRVKGETGVSFWQAYLGIYPNSLRESDSLIQAVGLHNGPGSKRFLKTRSELLERGLECLPEGAEGSTINVLSRILMNDGTGRYMPLLDFRLVQSPDNEANVMRVLDYLEGVVGLPFRVTKSRVSYHAYGLEAVSYGDYVSILGSALLFDPVVDGRHIAHQLIDGVGALRIK